MSTALHHGEALAYMASLAPGSIDAIIADPPYLTTNLHFDKAPSMDWAAWWAQAWRVVKPSGVVVLFAADLFTVDLILTQRANYRYRLVWEKSRPTGFFRANKQPLKGHEDILVFGKNGDSSTYNPQKSPARHAARLHKRNAARPDHYTTIKRADSMEDGSRYPTSVLYCESLHNAECLHPTEKPVPLMRELIRTYTNPGDTVLDCFAGSGSTLAACLMEGRHGVGCELDAGYYATATARLQIIENTPQLTFN